MAPVPGPPTLTVAVVYPCPGSVTSMAVMAPLPPTVAVAAAPVPSPVMVTGASASVSGLRAQLGHGPK